MVRVRRTQPTNPNITLSGRLPFGKSGTLVGQAGPSVTTDRSDGSEVGEAGDLASLTLRNDHGALLDLDPELTLPLEPSLEREVRGLRIVNPDIPKHHSLGAPLMVATQIGFSRRPAHQDGDTVEFLMARVKDVPGHR